MRLMNIIGKALQILQSHYASQGKSRIIALYTELISLKEDSNETITDYIILAEKTVTSLRNPKEVISDGLIIAMILKGLPDSYKPFAIHTEHKRQKILRIKHKSDNVRKVHIASVTYDGCGNHGHIVRDCRQKGVPKWCSYHKSSTHSDETCRRRKDEVARLL
ncbi:hypothetical protein Q7C36_007144 [Tachysurus vachellii]|uniref:Polyprotein n=1 Tax=Tachysurus vachellii TaxID=175792 RepID=A0AA88T239_TACVA|nr:hypothetical protein Q7C36_007144 [Tachysurus vachellii]